MKSYHEKVKSAVDEAHAAIKNGVSFCTATEHFADKYDVSLCDVQAST